MQVRLQPELLQILDDFAGEAATSRPEALRYVFSQWAEAYGYIKPKGNLRERSLMLSVDKVLLERIENHFGSMPPDEAIDCIVREWLEQKEPK